MVRGLKGIERKKRNMRKKAFKIVLIKIPNQPFPCGPKFSDTDRAKGRMTKATKQSCQENKSKDLLQRNWAGPRGWERTRVRDVIPPS